MHYSDCGWMAELADAAALRAGARKGVRVRVPLWPLSKELHAVISECVS
jgi:hypothetical protein